MLRSLTSPILIYFLASLKIFEGNNAKFDLKIQSYHENCINLIGLAILMFYFSQCHYFMNDRDTVVFLSDAPIHKAEIKYYA